MGGKKPITINETLDRLILDSSERVFYFAKKRLKSKRYAILLVIVAASIGFAFYSLFVRANIFNYYPTSCLGTWENPRNAEGKPSLEPGSPPEEFNGANSAFYDGSAKQIFCGGFKTDVNPSEKIFKKAVLKFSWAIAVSPAPAPEGAGGTAGTPTQVLQQSEFESEILDLTASASVIVIPDIPASASESLENQSSNPESTPEQVPLEPEPSPIVTEQPASPLETSTPEPTPELTTEPTPAPTPEPTAEPTPEPIPEPAPAEGPTSFIKNKILSAIFSIENGVSSPSLSTSQVDSSPSASPSATTSPTISPTASPAISLTVSPTVSPAEQPLTSTASPSQTASLSQSLDNFFEVSYSTDGQTWQTLTLVSDRNFNNLELEIPITSWIELDKLQISIRGTTSDVIRRIFLDGMRVEAQYEDIQEKMELETKELIREEANKLPQIKIDKSKVIKQPEGKSDFKADEEPWFEIDTNFEVPASPSPGRPTLPSLSPSPSPSPTISPSPSPTASKPRSSFLAWLIHKSISEFKNITRASPARALQLSDQVLVEVFDLKGHKTDIRPIVENVGGKTITRLPKSRAFKPGKYELRVLIIKNDEVYLTSQDFTWGVLAINPDKSIYLPGETADLAMAVLDEVGQMVCDSKVTLEITSPAGIMTTLSTVNGKIKINPECQEKAVTINPDYETHYQTTIAGSYRMKLTAVTQNGTWTIDDGFEVRQMVTFDVQRLSATRIFPPNPYPVTLIVKANQNYNGPIIDYAPASFDIQKVSSGGKVSTRGEEKMIIWKTELKKGETYEFSYNYLTPNISPQFYLIGPLSIGSFSEIRKWQIAVDSPLQMILFQDPADATPAGWTCISCAPGDDFYQIFPVGSSSYGGLSAAKGSAEHTPTATTNVAQTTSEVGANASTFGAATNHTHTPTPVFGPASNYPKYRVLKMIRNDAGVPDTLPQNAIAMFDTTDLPTGFSAYTSQDDYMILASGSSAPSTGGSDTHNHSISVSLNATSSAAGSKTGDANMQATATHNHTEVTGNTNTVNNVPQHASVVLRRVTTDGASVPNGMIAMFDDTPGTDWSVLSGSSGVLENDFIEASTSYNAASGGSNTHTDSAANMNSAADTSTGVKGIVSGTGYAAAGHIHVISFTNFNTINHRPPYKAVIIAKFALSMTFSIDAGSTMDFGTVQPGPSNRVYTTPCTNKCTIRLKVDTSNASGYNISAGRDRSSPATTLASAVQTSINISDTGGGINVFDGLGASCTDGTGPAVWVDGASTGLGFTLWAADIDKEIACWGNGSSETDTLNTYAALQASDAPASAFLYTSSSTPNPSYASVGFSLSVTTSQQATSYTGQVIFTATTNPP